MPEIGIQVIVEKSYLTFSSIFIVKLNPAHYQSFTKVLPFIHKVEGLNADTLRNLCQCSSPTRPRIPQIHLNLI